MSPGGIERLRLPGSAGEASVASVQAHLRTLGATEPHAWSNGPGYRYAAHRHPRTKLLMCVTGSITFLLDGAEVRLGAGDGMILPPQASHAAEAGPDGVTCVEGWRD